MGAGLNEDVERAQVERRLRREVVREQRSDQSGGQSRNIAESQVDFVEDLIAPWIAGG